MWPKAGMNWKKYEGKIFHIPGGRALLKATIIVTSRPWATKTIIENSVIQPDQHIEITTTPTLEFNQVLREEKVESNSRSKLSPPTQSSMQLCTLLLYHCQYGS